MKYCEIEPTYTSQAWSALESRRFEHLQELVVAVALHEEDSSHAVSLLIEAARASHTVTRGNAILGFGHLARRFGVLDRSAVEHIVAAGLFDEEDYVRSQAYSAADDLDHFLGWQILARTGS